MQMKSNTYAFFVLVRVVAQERGRSIPSLLIYLEVEGLVRKSVSRFEAFRARIFQVRLPGARIN